MPTAVATLTKNNDSLIVWQLPRFASYLQTAALIGIPVSLYLSLKILPPRPARYKRRRKLVMVAQWVWLPFVSIFYSSLTAFNSQTRLMLGKYLESFDVTVKHIKKD